jgi:hypothetical protein
VAVVFALSIACDDAARGPSHLVLGTLDTLRADRQCLGTRGYSFRHLHVFDATARVPMPIAAPDGRFAGVQVDRTVRTVDLMPAAIPARALRRDGWLLVEHDFGAGPRTPGTRAVVGRELAPRLAGECAGPEIADEVTPAEQLRALGHLVDEPHEDPKR